MCSVRVFVLGSGSSGNALLVDAERTRVLVDAGIGPRVAAARMEALGEALLPHGVAAIVATHHHGDHFGHVEKLARALGAPIYLHRGIDAPRVRRKHRVVDYDVGRPFRVGEIEIDTVRVPHDAPQVAVRLATKHHALGIATDVGHATPGLVAMLASCDGAIVEANHCPELLALGPYPQRLKQRVGGGYGHLSNARAAELAARLVGSRVGRLWLGHLSRANNTPERALETVATAARRIDVGVLPHGASCTIDVLRTRPVQLALPFA
jgi:phosphoribosyl 1,2-cyclic phosphodiesterase